MSVTVNEASSVLRSAVRATIRQRSYLYIFQGGVMCFGGVLALIYPLLAGTGLVATLGWVLVISALVQATSLWGSAQVPYFWLQLISVALELLVGYLLISSLSAADTAISMLLLVLFMVGGLTRIIFSLMVRPMQDWVWLLVGGLVSLGCAALLLVRLPDASAWLLGFLLGLHLIAGGDSIGWMAWHLGSGERL